MMKTSIQLIAVAAFCMLPVFGGCAAADEGTQAPEHLQRVASSWDTDWSKHAVPLSELMSGGPPRDGIPPIDDPKFVTPREAATWLADAEPVMVYSHDGEARAYPLQILTFHEIVNDVVGGKKIAVTFCPLCNSAMVFDRVVDGTTYTFGTSGLLRHSDLVMWDRQTESLWQQVTGEAIVGELVGTTLTHLPSSLSSFASFKSAHPEGLVLSRDTGHQRPYGQNPYTGYDAEESEPFLYKGTLDTRLPPTARIVTFTIGQTHYGIAYKSLETDGVLHETLKGNPIVAFLKKGTASALDGKNIATSRDVGSTGLFKRTLSDGRILTFERRNNLFFDTETGSGWNIFGEAVSGELKGTQLEQITSGDHFWFAWYAFRPDTILLGGQ